MSFLLKALFLLPFLLWMFYATLQQYVWQPQVNHSWALKYSRDTIADGGCGGYGNYTDDSCYEIESEDVEYETTYRGRWELASENSGLTAMHMFIFPNTNKAIMLDAVALGPSKTRLPLEIYRRIPDSKKKYADFWAHAVEYDIDTATIRPLMILTDTWSSSGGLSANGTVLISGGWSGGGRTVRYLSGCYDTCDWKEHRRALSGKRWYSTQHILPDGSFIVVGGRGMFNYEYLLTEGNSEKKMYELPLLRETTDPGENNLYPFVFLSTDGNLFIFANNRSILLNPTVNKIIRELPALPGGSRNYPASAMSALLPIKLHDPNPDVIQAEVLICGGAKSQAASLAVKGVFVNALRDCARIDITNPMDTWHKEKMPSPRVMGDMLLLPTGDVLIINGAKKGTAGWNVAYGPNMIPVLYKPDRPARQRFMELTASIRPRTCHSTSTLLPNGNILVAGSNPSYRYNVNDSKYPTELRVEKFYPPYFDQSLISNRPLIISTFNNKMIKYGKKFVIKFKLKRLEVSAVDLKVTMYAPPFTTHGISMGQRLLILSTDELIEEGPEIFKVSVMAPPTATIAPLGYYLVFVVHSLVPSPGAWVQIG